MGNSMTKMYHEFESNFCVHTVVCLFFSLFQSVYSFNSFKPVIILFLQIQIKANKYIYVIYFQSGTCSLREAVIISSVLMKTSVPVLHASAVMLKIAEIDYSGVA